MTIQIKRAYEPASDSDGCRVLVDRLWPRGVSKERAHLDSWLKEVAPSPELRTWWRHDPERMEEFALRYRAELDGDPLTVTAVAALRALVARGPATLVYGAKDPHVNHARLLAEYLAESPA
ncbi:hypothetical protein JF66_15385 [Cryobacterium sp. MLB-32]|uniref:DUF488 domain-containing protein n=1 Tax=Cryobacterium sp. MLB-32 TaxID=1529318 RepID=UPI0004E6D1F5|nr:DUF488 family protein [Cryobacterium sp. MLB-32]KFF58886.1 hypothetical protein JF66_15385 [Cryobacterium sp. MLB-32]